MAHEAARAAGRKVAHYFLLGGPGETMQTLNNSLADIDKLRKTVLFLVRSKGAAPSEIQVTVTHLFVLTKNKFLLHRKFWGKDVSRYAQPGFSPIAVCGQVPMLAPRSGFPCRFTGSAAMEDLV